MCIWVRSSVNLVVRSVRWSMVVYIDKRMNHFLYQNESCGGLYGWL